MFPRYSYVGFRQRYFSLVTPFSHATIPRGSTVLWHIQQGSLPLHLSTRVGLPSIYATVASRKLDSNLLSSGPEMTTSTRSSIPHRPRVETETRDDTTDAIPNPLFRIDRPACALWWWPQRQEPVRDTLAEERIYLCRCRYFQQTI